MKTAREILNNRVPYSVTVNKSVWDTLLYMKEVGVGAVAVLDGEKVVGIFSERDLLKRIVLPGKDPHATSIREVMTADPAVCAAEELSHRCMERMEEHHCRHLPVVDNGKLVGLLSMRDLLHEELEEAKHELGHLHSYIHGYPTMSENPRASTQ